MRKLLYFYLFFALSLFAGQEKVEVYATTITSKLNTIKATGEVIVVYKDSYLSAKSAIYNKENGDLELFDDVRANNSGEYKVLGNYAKLNIAKKERTFQPFYMHDNESLVWISGDKGDAKEDDIKISSGVTSGCNPNDPLWKIEFSTSEYNTESKWLHLYNARLYIYDIPIIYTPYFGYPLDKTRRTGLLLPTFGISNREGFYYEQPLYIAEQNWWDLELRPQIRTQRGEGIYGEFRFVDSFLSRGSLKAGFFKEKPKYIEELKNKYENEQKKPTDKDFFNEEHYGFNFLYENKDILKSWFDHDSNAQTGLYIDINHMNDVEYINLSSNDTTTTETATQVLSKINAFYNTDKNYIGTYFKYYKNLEEKSNENTLQKLPTLHYHHYLSGFFDNHFLYNVNIQSNNIYREVGKKVVQTDIDIPLTLQTSLFDEYMQLSYQMQLYGQHSNFSGDEEQKSGEYENGYYIRNHHILKASTQLTKGFEDFIHVMGFGATLIAKENDKQDGYYEDIYEYCSKKENQNESQCDFYAISPVEEVIKLDFSQYIFDSNAKQKIYHRLAQNINYKTNDKKFGELENELDIALTDSISYYNNLFYNYEEKAFSKILNQISYTNSQWNFTFSHLYGDTFKEKKLNYTPYTSYITTKARYTYNEHYSYHAGINYDYENREKKSAEIGFMYKKRCWDFGLRFVENVRPIGQTSENDRYVYITIVLKPLMGNGGTNSDFALRLPDKLMEN